MIRFIESTNTDGFQLTFDGSDNKLKFISDSSGTEATRMVIQRTDGYVGIGTTSPSEKLHVSGTLAITDTATVKQTARVQAGDSSGVTLESFDATTLFGAFVDYVVYDAGRDNTRAGTLQIVFNASAGVQFTDNSTTDIGDTTTAYFDVTNPGSSPRLWFYADSSDWSVRYHIRYL